tara:strand:- start:231 stop:515 length:285 start_codon:yes stop_codon:yes gene_type:complete
MELNITIWKMRMCDDCDSYHPDPCPECDDSGILDEDAEVEVVASWQEEDRSVGLSGDLDIVSAQWAKDGGDVSLSVPDRRTVAERARDIIEGAA